MCCRKGEAGISETLQKNTVGHEGMVLQAVDTYHNRCTWLYASEKLGSLACSKGANPLFYIETQATRLRLYPMTARRSWCCKANVQHWQMPLPATELPKPVKNFANCGSDGKLKRGVMATMCQREGGKFQECWIPCTDKK